MGLQQIVYISTTAQDYSEAEFCQMLKVFSKHNYENKITGILIYKKFRFMQLIEGEKETIERLYAKIKADPRHQDVLQIVNSPTTVRHFTDWSMNFYNLSKVQPLELAGYSDYLETDLDSSVFRNSEETFKFLRIFKLSTVSV